MDRRLPLLVVGISSVVLVAVIVIVAGFPTPSSSNPPLPPPVNPPPPPTPAWTRLNTTASPASNSSMMAYLPIPGELLLLDSGGSCTSSSTWAFASGIWRNLTAEVGPGPYPARALAGMVYDAADHYLVLFGGASACGVYNDTWSFANNTWTPIPTATAPPPLYSFAMTYDAADGYVLLTGGCCIHGKDSNETWAFAHGQWTNLSQSPSPVVDSDSAMTYDSTLGEVVYVGGYAHGFVSQATWIFHGGTWTRLYPAVSPSNRAGMGLAYDAALAKVVLVGGYTKVALHLFINLSDTWTYGGGVWENLTSGLNVSPPFVSEPSLMAYDPASQEMVLFLGYEQTWVFR